MPVPKTFEALDESVLLRITGSLRQYITSAVSSSLDQVLKEIRSDREDMNKLRENVEGLTSIITTTASAMFIKNPSANPRTKEIRNKLCLLPPIFNYSIMLQIIPRVVIGFIVKHIKTGSALTDLELKGIQQYSILHFSKKPKENRKEKFGSEVGQIYSKYRCSLLMSSFLAMQNNSFKTFRADPNKLGAFDSINLDEESSTVGPSLIAMIQPFWLRPGYITSEHCLTAARKLESRSATEKGDDTQDSGESSQLESETRGDEQSTDMLESSQSSGKQKVSHTGPLTQDEIATEAAVMLYKIITATLTKSRNATKMQLFHDVLYIFTGWSQFTDIVDQSTLNMRWEGQLEQEKDYTTNLPWTKVVRLQDRRSNMGQDEEKSDLENLTHLQSIIGKHPELSLLVNHNVLVNGTKKILRYRVSLIEVACRALSAYITNESAAKAQYALCADKRSLKAVVVFALGLRKLMEKAVLDSNELQSVPWQGNTYPTKNKRGRPKATEKNSRSDTSLVSQYNFECIDGFALGYLQPAPSKQKEVLSNMILNLTPEEYNDKFNNHQPCDIVGTSGLEDREARIEADENEFIFEL